MVIVATVIVVTVVIAIVRIAVLVILVVLAVICDMAPLTRDSHQAEASRIAAAVPGIQSPWLHAKACSSRIPKPLDFL